MNKNIDRHLLTIIIIIVALGTIIVFNTSVYMSFLNKNNSYALLKKHIVFLIISIIAGFIAYKIPFFIWRKIAPMLYGIGVLLLMYLLILGPVIKHTRRWLVIGGINLQVSEFMKFAIILFIAWWIDKFKDSMNDLKKGFIFPVIGILLPAILIALEPSYSMAGIVTIAGFITLFLGKMRWKYILISFLIVSFLFPALLTRKKYTAGKINKIMNVWQNDKEDIHTDQTYISIVFTGSGKLFGKGIGKGRAKMATVQEVYRDFVFAVIGEETGFIGGMLIILLYFLLFSRIFAVAIKMEDSFASVSLIGIGSVLLFMSLLHIATNIGIFPNTGVPLPFMTVGGSSLLMNMIALGYVLSVIKEYSDSGYSPINRRRTIAKDSVYFYGRNRRSYNSWFDSRRRIRR